jgi:Spy/CpxP family protein refolding chaperone
MSHKHGMFKALGVTDDQKAQLKDFLQKYRPTLQSLMKQYHAEMHALRKLIHEGPIDESAISAQARQILQFRAHTGYLV